MPLQIGCAVQYKNTWYIRTECKIVGPEDYRLGLIMGLNITCRALVLKTADPAQSMYIGIDVGELERLGGLDHKMPWKSVFALIKDTEMRLHNSLLSVPLGCLWMQKWWSGRGRLLSTTKWPSLGTIQIYFTLQLSPFYTYLNLDMPCSDEFCPGAILPGGAIAPPAPPSPTSMGCKFIYNFHLQCSTIL